MDTEVRELWTAALRSGDYPQTAGILRGPAGYCCLGVLCELAVKADVIPSARECKCGEIFETASCGAFKYGEDGDASVLPREVAEWAGLASRDPYVGTKCLSAINDSGTDFLTIANLIDAYLKDGDGSKAAEESKQPA